MTPTVNTHIRLDERGVAYVDDTRFKVIHVALDKIAYGWSAEEIVAQHDNCLSLAQVHAALAYYYDHQAAFDAEIKRDDEEYDRLWAANLNSPLHQKLRAKGLIP